jgi:chromate transport protein ChrA
MSNECDAAIPKVTALAEVFRAFEKPGPADFGGQVAHFACFREEFVGRP